MLDRMVQLWFDGPVAHIRLNRPDALNAFCDALIGDLDHALDLIDESEDCRAIVIGGHGRAFGTGGDLKEFLDRLADPDPANLPAFIDKVAGVLTRIEGNPRPVIAAVNGIAVAGGLELILCCDLVIAVEDVVIGDGHLRYGVLPGGGGAVRLIRKVPANVARQLLLTSELTSATELHRHGLINELVASVDQLEERAQQIAETIATRTPLGVRSMKSILAGAADVSLREGLKLELEAFETHIRTSDFSEGMRAFAERRDPSFSPLADKAGR
jgi:enoyl-CoA hydratase/carnithine racemase